jgi:hypothetical protein
VTIKVLRDEPIELTAVSSTRDNFLIEMKELEKGRSYEVVMTPKSTAEPTLGAVKLETNCELPRNKNRLIFVNVVRSRRPAAAGAPAAAAPAAAGASAVKPAGR